LVNFIIRGSPRPAGRGQRRLQDDTEDDNDSPEHRNDNDSGIDRFSDVFPGRPARSRREQRVEMEARDTNPHSRARSLAL
ncbi:MAG: hypothetical protein AAGI88_23980, partial [Pseudomonadota bacterium]